MMQWINEDVHYPEGGRGEVYMNGGQYSPHPKLLRDARFRKQLNALQSTTRGFRPIIEHKDWKALPDFCIDCDEYYATGISGMCAVCENRESMRELAKIPVREVPEHQSGRKQKQKRKHAAFWWRRLAGIIQAIANIRPAPKPKKKNHEPTRSHVEYGQILGGLLYKKRKSDKHGMWVSLCPACGKKLWTDNSTVYGDKIGYDHAGECPTLASFIDARYPKQNGALYS